jgi:hypothetical protein
VITSRYPSLTYWNRVEPSPRSSDSLQRGLEAAVRDPLWFLARQWQLGEFRGEDAASPASASFAASFSRLDGWRPGAGPMRPYDGSAPLEALVQNEATTPDLRLAVELGQALERRLAEEGAAPEVVDAFRAAWPIPRPADLSPAESRDRKLVRLARVCGGRGTNGVDALAAARAAAPALPAEPALPPGGEAPARAALTWLVGWAAGTYGPVGPDDAAAWRPERLEYALEVEGPSPDGGRVRLRGDAGPYGEYDWYAFDEIRRDPPPKGPPAGPPLGPKPGAPAPVRFSVLPASVRFSGMPNSRWWYFEDARYNWAAVDADRRDLGKLLVVDFMLVQSNDWFMVPFGQEVGTMVAVEQLLVRDVFGDWTLVPRADAAPGTGGARWTMFSTAAEQAATGLADWFLLPPGALRTTLDGPDLEEVRFVRDEQANVAWAVEATTEDGTGRPLPGRERALDVPDETPPARAGAPLRYLLQTPVPVNWIPLVPVQVDAGRRAVALERAAMERVVDGTLQPVPPAGRVLRPTNLADPDVYHIREEEVPRGGTRVLRADRRTRWTDGSTHLWTSRRRHAGTGEAASGLRYDVAERTDPAPWHPAEQPFTQMERHLGG